jgi:integrase/recombinase XerD
MTLLRQKMIEAMQQRGFSDCTHESYLYAVTDLAKHFHKSPDQIQVSQIQDYFVYLAQDRHLGGATCRLYYHGIRFLYLQVLHWEQFDVPIHYPKLEQKIPELLTQAEVKQIILACTNHKHRMMLMTCYGCGLRVSELVALKVRHIDGERKLLRVEQGKGSKDRAVVISPGLLDQLRRYWLDYRPDPWLFPTRNNPTQHLQRSTPQKVFSQAKSKAGIEKVGGIHSLRHAYATCQLENGMPIHQLQKLLGHKNIQSTLRYVHWIPGCNGGESRMRDLVGDLEVSDA